MSSGPGLPPPNLPFLPSPPPASPPSTTHSRLPVRPTRFLIAGTDSSNFMECWLQMSPKFFSPQFSELAFQIPMKGSLEGWANLFLRSGCRRRRHPSGSSGTPPPRQHHWPPLVQTPSILFKCWIVPTSIVFQNEGKNELARLRQLETSAALGRMRPVSLPSKSHL